MTQTKSSSELKTLAKGQLLGKYSTTSLVLLAQWFILFLLNFILFAFRSNNLIADTLIQLAASFIISLLWGVMDYGISHFYLNLACGRQYSVSDIFAGFKNHPDHSIRVKFYIVLFTQLSLLPVTLCNIWYLFNPQAYVFLILCITLTAGITVSIYFSLMFTPAFYLLLDFEHQKHSPYHIIQMSRDLMDGHKGRLFSLTVSFLPLILVGFLSCGIAYLWLMPYIQLTKTHFYLDLIRIKTASHSTVTENE